MADPTQSQDTLTPDRPHDLLSAPPVPDGGAQGNSAAPASPTGKAARGRQMSKTGKVAKVGKHAKADRPEPMGASGNGGQPSRTGLTGPVRIMLGQLRHTYADASPARWEELRVHMDLKIAGLGSGTPERRAMVIAAFEDVRDQCLARQRTRKVSAALQAGQAELVRDTGEGQEEWAVTVEGEPAPLRLLLPTVGDPVMVAAARAALLGGHCRTCQLHLVLTGDLIDVPHNPKCDAVKALA